MASKKGVGSSKNGRDSISKRLGVKTGDGQYVSAGSIIVIMPQKKHPEGCFFVFLLFCVFRNDRANWTI